MKPSILFASCVWLSGGVPGLTQQITFQPPISLPTQAGPIAMATADFNGDGMVDLVVSDVAAHVISVSLGNGDGTFQQAVNYPVPSGCTAGSLTVADFNNDHKLDLLAICEFANQLFVFPGRGDGTFATPVSTQLPAPAFAGNLFLEVSTAGLGEAVADFNGDGKLDLVLVLSHDLSTLGTPSTNAYFLPGNGDGSFGMPVRIQSGVAVAAMATADFNGDHKPDLAYVALTSSTDADGNMTFTQSLSIQLGNGDGTFQAGPTYPWTGATFGLLATDLNGDGFIDLLSVGLSLSTLSGGLTGSSITVMLGDGHGNLHPGFTGNDPANDYAVSFCLANLRGNGPVDLLETIEMIDPSAQTAAIQLGARAGDGKGNFQSLQTFAGPQFFFPFGAACVDLNGDGLTDALYTGISALAVAGVLGGNGSSNLKDLVSAFGSLPAGNLYIALNAFPQMLTFSDVNAASFEKGPLATNSIATAFWNGPPKPAGIGLNVKDSAGVTRAAQIFFLSSKQINYAIPDGTAIGNATFTITGTQDTFTAHEQIAAVAPGVFAAEGLAVGGTITVHNGKQIPGNLVQTDSSGKLQPVPIDVGSGSDQVFLILYGTGIRNHATPVMATIGTTPAPVVFAAAQGTFVDEDQINVLVPQSLRGAGRVNLMLNVDGQTTNPVIIEIK